MFLVNLAYLNASNGMFWYAIDKINSLREERSGCMVLVGQTLAPLIRRELPDVTVVETTRLTSWLAVLRLRRTRPDARLVTFTPHPMPFIGPQTIAFYDPYPFQGFVGRLKRWLFVVGVKTSRCRVGIINRSLALPFLHRCGVRPERTFFDTAFPSVDVENVTPRSAVPRIPPRIGLVGTDSRKKNYAAIFRAAISPGPAQSIRFYLYGSENDYTRELRVAFPEIAFSVVPSDTIAIPDFFAMIDYLISAATGEGYGRPMGLAVRLGVPLFLLRSPVFLEFFSDHAHFFNDVTSMLRFLVEARPSAAAPISGVIETAIPRSPFFA